MKKFKDLKLDDQFRIKTDMDLLSFPDQCPSPVDLLHEQRLYGKVDRLNSPVRLLIDGADSLATVKGSRGVMVLNFVARAFRDLQREYASMVSKRALQPLVGMSSLDPYRGWSDLGEYYAAHVKAFMFTTQVMSMSRYNQSIRDFGDFVRVCFQVMRESKEKILITKSGLLMSSTTPNRVSGLVLDILPHSKSEEETKLVMLTHPAFPSFANMCARYGFRIDRTSPWTLVANLNSRAMGDYAKVSGVSLSPNGGNIFEKFYTKTHLEDMDSLRSVLPRMYNDFVAKRPEMKINKYSEKGDLMKLTHVREPLRGPSDGYDLRFWMEVLLKVRLMETDLFSTVDQETFDRIIERCLQVEKKYGLEVSLNHLNQAMKNLSYDLNLLARKIKNVFTPKQLHHIMLTIHKK